MDLPYESDLTDEQWELVSPSLAPSKRARPRLYGERDLLNAIFYVLRAGCQWRMVPHEYPQWQSVYHHFKRWHRLGAFDRMLEALLPLTRKKGGSRNTLTHCLSTLYPLNRPIAVKRPASMAIRKSVAESIK